MTTPVIVYSDVEITRDNLGTNDRFLSELRTWAAATGDENLFEACHTLLDLGDGAPDAAFELVLRELNARRVSYAKR
jgi:hypothetical protein